MEAIKVYLAKAFNMLLVIYLNDMLMLRSINEFQQYYLLTTLVVYLSILDFGYTDYVRSRNANGIYRDNFFSLLIYSLPLIIIVGFIFSIWLKLSFLQLFFLAYGNIFIYYISNQLYLKKLNHVSALLALLVNVCFYCLIKMEFNISSAYSSSYFVIGITAIMVFTPWHKLKKFSLDRIRLRDVTPYVVNRLLYAVTNFGLSLYILSEKHSNTSAWALYHRVFLIVSVISNVYLSHRIRDTYLSGGKRERLNIYLVVTLISSFSIMIFASTVRYNLPLDIGLFVFFLIWLIMDSLLLFQVLYIDLQGHTYRTQKFSVLFVFVLAAVLILGNYFGFAQLLAAFVFYLLLKYCYYEVKYFKSALFRSN